MAVDPNLIKKDYTRDDLLPPISKATLEDRYMLETEKSPQDAFARASAAFADDLDHAQRLYDYSSRFWFMFSTPILANGGTQRGLPISCVLNYVPDSRNGLMDHYTETAWLSTVGAGIGGYWGDVRSSFEKTSKGSTSSGTIPFMKVVDSVITAFRQGGTRRGSYAAYMDISHPEIEEFIKFRKPSGGDVNRLCLNLNNAVNITDDFMRAVETDSQWNLVDPHSKKVTKTVSARKLWLSILELRMSTGEPYLHFIDTTNKHLPATQKAKGLRVRQSNLCSEITLPTDEQRTAVCCLSSLNADTFDEWRNDELFIEDVIRMLDNVLTFFIENAPPAASKAVYSAIMERSIGLGLMGFHSYLQSKGYAFDSIYATGINSGLFKLIKDRAVAASKKLAAERGSPSDMAGTGLRFAHLLAIAPNASSGIICGNVSPSVELIKSNAFVSKTLSGSFLVKNKYLEKVLEGYGRNTQDVWTSIITNAGSVQHLDFLSDDEKEVFKTAIEVSQFWVIDHAAIRQQYICQAQSINLFFPPDVEAKELNMVHLSAWKKGLKTLYYCRSEAGSRPETVAAKIERQIMNLGEVAGTDDEPESCLMCEG